jgi:hypothetical protein
MSGESERLGTRLKAISNEDLDDYLEESYKEYITRKIDAWALECFSDAALKQLNAKEGLKTGMAHQNYKNN